MKIIQSELHPYRNSLKAHRNLPQKDRQAYAELDRKLRLRELENNELLHNMTTKELKHQIDKNLEEIKDFRSKLLPVETMPPQGNFGIENGVGNLPGQRQNLDIHSLKPEIENSQKKSQISGATSNQTTNRNGITDGLVGSRNNNHQMRNAFPNSSPRNQVKIQDFKRNNIGATNQKAKNTQNRNYSSNNGDRPPQRLKVEAGIMNGIPLAQSQIPAKGPVYDMTVKVQQLEDDYLNSVFNRASLPNVSSSNNYQTKPQTTNNQEMSNQKTLNAKNTANSKISNRNSGNTNLGNNVTNQPQSMMADKTLIKQVLSGVGMSHLAQGYYREGDIQNKRPEDMGQEMFESIKVSQQLRHFERKAQNNRRAEEMTYAGQTANHMTSTIDPQNQKNNMTNMMLSTKLDALINQNNPQAQRYNPSDQDPEVKAMFGPNTAPLNKKEVLRETLNLEGHQSMPMRSPQFLTYGEQVDTYLDSILGKSKAKPDSIFFEKSVLKAPPKKETEEVFGLLESLKKTFELTCKPIKETSEIFGKGKFDFFL